jgi:hypothetical protein
VTKAGENRLTVHNLQSEATAWHKNTRSFGKDSFIFILCLKKAEGVHHYNRVTGASPKRNTTDVTSNPVGRTATFGTKALRLPQEAGCGINANDIRTKLRECQRVSPMTATKVNDACSGM